MANKDTATIILSHLLKHFDECEASWMEPNFVCMHEDYFSLLCLYFPYLVKDGKFIHQNKSYDILLTKKDMIGLSLSFFTEDLNGSPTQP